VQDYDHLYGIVQADKYKVKPFIIFTFFAHDPNQYMYTQSLENTQTCPVYESRVVAVRATSIDLDDWVTIVQSQDEKCKELLKALACKPSSPRDREIRRDYTEKRGRLYRRTAQGVKWVVPYNVRAQILRMYHDDAGHPGITKTEELVRRRFWFPKLRKYVEDYTRACLNCLYAKPNRGVSSGPLHPIPKPRIPMDTLHMDFVGPFVLSARKNKHLLVTVDSFTKYTWLWPTKTTATRGVISFLDQLIGTYGVPRRIIADRGTSFSSTEFNNYCREKNVKLILTAVACPRAAGQVERINAIVIEKLTAMISDNEKTWDKYLDQVKMSINNAVSETTKKSPNELFFGFQPRTTAEAPLVHELHLEEDEMQVDKESAQQEYDKNREQIRAVAQRNNELRQNQLRERTSTRKKPPTYQVGDAVVLLNANPSTKTTQKFKGPYKITAVYPNDRYKVEGFDERHRRYTSVHAPEHLKLVTVQKESDNDSANDTE
jgi:transposase InsO family protein